MPASPPAPPLVRHLRRRAWSCGRRACRAPRRQTPRRRALPRGSRALDALKQRDQELTALRVEQRRALENEAKLRRDIESIGDDRRKLNAQLIESAARVRAIEAEITQTKERLQPLDDREQALRKSLDERRGVIGEVLAALQRIGRHRRRSSW